MKQISYEELRNLPDGTKIIINDLECIKVSDGIHYKDWYEERTCPWEIIDKKLADGNVILTIYVA